MGTNGSRGSLRRRVSEWNEEGRLYLWGGALSAVVAWFVVPLFGLIAVYCGYKLYDEEDRTVSAALIAGFGAVGFLLWIAFLLTL